MAVVVVNEVEFGVVMLRGPLEGLGDVAGSGYVPERSVGIRRADVAGGAEDFADVFRDVVAVGEPGAVFLDRERTRRRRLRRIPGDTFRTRIVAEGVILRRAVARSRTCERTPERVVSIVSQNNIRSRAAINPHSRNQIPLVLVSLHKFQITHGTMTKSDLCFHAQL